MKKPKSKKRMTPANRTRLDHIDPDGTIWFASDNPQDSALKKQLELIRTLSGDNPLGIDAFTGNPNQNKFI